MFLLRMYNFTIKHAMVTEDRYDARAPHAQMDYHAHPPVSDTTSFESHRGAASARVS